MSMAASRWDPAPGTAKDGTVCPACSPAVGGDSFGCGALSRPHCSANLKYQANIGLRPAQRPTNQDSRRAAHFHGFWVPCGGMTTALKITSYAAGRGSRVTL